MIGFGLERLAESCLRYDRESEAIVVSASELGREYNINPSQYQDKYHLRVLLVSGNVSGKKVIASAGISSKQHIEIDGVIICEFGEIQSGVNYGDAVEVYGLCSGKMLTGCRLKSCNG